MKKLLLTLSVIAGLLSNAFAIDLISLATNGKSNENSLGVKTLNNQEMSKIIGGAYIYMGNQFINMVLRIIAIQKFIILHIIISKLQQLKMKLPMVV